MALGRTVARRRRTILLSLAVLLPLACVPGNAQWLMEESGTTAGLRGIHAVDTNVAWASGAQGTVIHTDDGGTHWQRCPAPPGAEKLDFRGVWAWNSQRALVMSIGPGDQSRLFKTMDGCKTWTQLYINPDAKGFWDGIVFTTEQKGALLGDPVNGTFVILLTRDGGEHWSRSNSSGAAADPRGEGAFAASNTALVVRPQDAELQFGTGRLGGPRVFRADVPGEWKSAIIPLTTGAESAGVFSLGYRDRDYGVAVGGDYQRPADSAGTAAFTSDGGQTWTSSAALPSGFRSAVAWEERVSAWVAVGTNGADVSFDDGRTWRKFDGEHNWNALSLPWAVGPKGKIGKLSYESLKPK